MLGWWTRHLRRRKPQSLHPLHARTISPLLLPRLLTPHPTHIRSGHIPSILIPRGRKRGLQHLPIVIGRQSQIHQAVKIVQHLGVPEHAGAPVEINAALELGVGFGDLRLQLCDGERMDGRCAREAHVDVVVWERVEVRGLRVLADRGQTLEGELDVVSGVGEDPFTVR